MSIEKRKQILIKIIINYMIYIIKKTEMYLLSKVQYYNILF